MSSSADAKPLTICILSGSTGRTCDEVLRAALAQFGQPDVRVVRRTRLRSEAEVVREVRYAADAHAVICHSLVVPQLRETLVHETTRLRVPTVDVLGPLMTLLQDYLGQTPRGLPGLAFQMQRERLERIDAVDYTLAHDDGCGLADLAQADVVLVGAGMAAYRRIIIKPEKLTLEKKFGLTLILLTAITYCAHIKSSPGYCFSLSDLCS